MAALSLVFDILARDNASRDFDRIGDNADRMGRRVGSAGDEGGKRFGGGLKAGVALAAGAIAGLGLASVFKGFVEEAAESAKIGRLTDAVIKSTGGSAKITAEQVGDLATAISNKTAVDDEAIQSGANLLLTFTKVRDEVGAGNDIFTQATAAAVDMSVALGTDVTGASLQLGKALNDPIKGIGALSRAGVSFTAEQKEQVKTLVATGDVLGAQKIILGELSTQFGGAAAAAADPIARLKVVAGNLGEEIGGKLLPTVEKFATLASDKLIPVVGQIANTVRDNVLPVMQGFAGFLRDEVGPRLLVVAGFVRDNLLPPLRDFGGYVRDTVLPLLRDFATTVLEKVRAGLETLRTKIQENRPQLDALAVLFRELIQFMVEKGLPILGKIAGILATDLFNGIGFVITALGTIIRVSGEVLVAMLGMVSGILGGIGKVFETLAKVPGPFQDSFKKAAESVAGAKVSVEALQTGLKNLPALTKVQVDGETGIARGGVEGVHKSIRDLPRLTSVKVDADTGPARAQVESLLRFVSGASARLLIRDTGNITAGRGDGPGAGGSMLARVSKLIAGTGMSVTSTYRTPARNAAVGGSPTSYHMDRGNPAVDVVGPSGALDRLQSQLRASGGLRELLWRVPGHFDHLHVAHEGGMISSSWPTLPGLRSDERPLIGQVGERVLSRSEVASGGGQTNHYNITTPAVDSFGLVNLLRRMEMLNA